jgi:hypothetical protein
VGWLQKLKGAVAAGQSAKTDTDPADLSHASAYFREHRGEIDAFYRPYPAEVPRPTSDRPAIFVKVPLGTLNTFGQRVDITYYEVLALKLATHAVLWIRLFARDPDGSPLRAMIPGELTISTFADVDKLSTVPFDLFLNPSDPAILRWLEAWVTHPELMFYFVVDEADRIAAHVWYPNNPTLAEVVRPRLSEAQQFQSEIPASELDFAAAAAAARAALEGVGTEYARKGPRGVRVGG